MNLRSALALTLALIPTAGRAQEPAAPSAAQVARIDSIFGKWSRKDSPGCAVSVARDDQILFEKGYGMSNLEYDVPITPASIFHVASMSKEFTALSIVLLAQQGKLSLDDDVRKYIPELPSYGTTITLRHLLHHTSGIRDQWSLLDFAGWRDDDPITMDDILWVVARQKELNFPPGSQYAYSNSGFTLAAEVVKRVSGKTLRQFAQENIFAPLGMTHTHFHDDHTMIVPGRTSAYVRRDSGGWAISIPVFDNAGATSLFTTVEDLAKWNANFLTQRVGGDAGWAMMLDRFVLTDGDTIAYALGLIHGKYRGLETIGHNGADAGYRSAFTRFIQPHIGISVLCNTPPQPDPSTLANRVADVVLADRLQPPPSQATKAAPAPAADLAALPGVYWADATEAMLRIEARGDSLVIARGLQATALVPLAPGRYRRGSDPVILTFSGSGAGRRVEERAEGQRGTITWTVQPALAHPPTAAELQALAGRYYGEEVDNTWVLSARGDSLHLRWRKSDDMTLRPLFADAFGLGGMVLRFQR
ncbi:MAG TPA: serine hydrolase domain-containing protein, partial [Longimicrobiales bacterium]